MIACAIVLPLLIVHRTIAKLPPFRNERLAGFFARLIKTFIFPVLN
jgi:hypothetical protein